MPLKTSSGKWKWGNIERSSKKELVQTVYGIWKKNGSKGSFSDFWHGKHKSESVVSEDKAAMIKKLVLPDIEDEDEKKNYKWIIQGFFYKHPSYEKEIDWNKWKTLTKKDFDKVMALADNSRKARKEKERMGFGKDPKKLFKNVEGRKFKIVDENDSWLFVAPLNYAAAVFCDSKECGGGSATWCIGTKNNTSYWNNYISNDSKFIMAFSKKFETMPEKDLFSELKYMFQQESDSSYLIWNQMDDDDDAATDVNQTKFKKNLKQFEELFSKVKAGEYSTTIFQWNDGNKEEGQLEKIFLNSKHYLKFPLPKETEEVFDYATVDEGNEEDALIDELILNDSLKTIGSEAFANVQIKKISYSEDCKLDLIGREAFRGNHSIKELDLSGLKDWLTIDSRAFSNCKNLKSVKLPPNTDSLYNAVFDGCMNLRYLEIPKKFIDPRDNYKELGKICGHIDWDEIQVVPIDEHGKKSANESLISARKKESKEMTNEAHEIHSYPEKLQPIIERIVKDNEDYELDHAYFNKEGKFIWMRNLKGYFHVFKPVKFVKTPGMTKPFGFKDLILKDNGMLEEVDRLRFINGNDGLAYLNKKYNLDLKTIG